MGDDGDGDADDDEPLHFLLSESQQRLFILQTSTSCAAEHLHDQSCMLSLLLSACSKAMMMIDIMMTAKQAAEAVRTSGH